MINLDKVIFPLKTTGLVFLSCLASILLLCLGVGIMNPFISGFLHQGVEHLVTNLVLLFLLLLPKVNRTYDVTKIFWVTTVLSLLYLPISLSGISPPSIGISGTCYFLLTRYCLTREKFYTRWMLVLGLLTVLELVSMTNLADGTSHGVHLFGILFGGLSLRPLSPSLQKFLPMRIVSSFSALP